MAVRKSTPIQEFTAPSFVVNQVRFPWGCGQRNPRGIAVGALFLCAK